MPKGSPETDSTMSSPSRPQPPPTPPMRHSPPFAFPPGFVPFTPVIPPYTQAPVIPPFTPVTPPFTPVIPPSMSPASRHVHYAPAVEEINPSPMLSGSQRNSVYSTFVCGEHEWRQYIHPNGSLYWSCPTQRVVSDKPPHIDTIASLQLLLLSLHSLHDFMQWEVYLAANSSHFVHHGSCSMSRNCQMLPGFKEQIQQRLNIETSESLRDQLCAALTRTIITGFELEVPYWMFVQSHPNHTRLPDGAKDEAEEALLWCYAGQYSETIMFII